MSHMKYKYIINYIEYIIYQSYTLHISYCTLIIDHKNISYNPNGTVESNKKYQYMLKSYSKPFSKRTLKRVVKKGSWTDRCTDGWMDGWTDTRMEKKSEFILKPANAPKGLGE